MKVVIASDSFKECLSSLQAGGAIRRGVLSACPDADVSVFPLADGGEGTVDALVQGLGGEKVSVCVRGPLGERVAAPYGLIPRLGLAVIEVSAAVGLSLLERAARNPLETSSYGVGELILDALDRGCREFIVGLGGSSTNDAGIGMLSALGFRFLNARGEPAGICGKDVGEVVEVDASRADGRLRECVFRLALDVSSPLCGPKGASLLFSPQKGAAPETAARLEEALRRFSAAVARRVGRDVSGAPGAGAAGGLGFAFMAFFRADSRRGVDVVLDAVGLEKAMESADLAVTGEGRLDSQTAMGKAPLGVARLAKKHGAAVIAFCGGADGGDALNARGIDAYFPILRGPMSLEEAMSPVTAEKNLEEAARQVFLLIGRLRRTAETNKRPGNR